MLSIFAAHPRIRVIRTEGQPAEKYVVEFHVLGLIPDGQAFRQGNVHQAEVFLPLDYPAARLFAA